MSNTIAVKRNNDLTLAITVKKDGTPENITGWVIYFSVKKVRNSSDASAIIYKEVTVHTDPTAGESSISIDAVDTKDKEVGTYYYDLLFVDDQDKRQSTVTDLFQLVQEVTDGDA